MTRKLLITIWMLGVVLSAGGAGLELYRFAWLGDWSIETVTLFLFWLFTGRKAWSYMLREMRRPVAGR